MTTDQDIKQQMDQAIAGFTANIHMLADQLDHVADTRGDLLHLTNRLHRTVTQAVDHIYDSREPREEQD